MDECLPPLAPGVRRWQAFHPGIRVEWGCHALRGRDGRWVMIDPIGGPDALGWDMAGRHVVAAVVATNGNHERAALAWAGQGAHAPAFLAPPGSGLSFPPWHELVPGASWIDDWEVVDLAGGGPGEVALRVPSLDLVVLGDAVVNLPGRGLELLPAKYCSDPDRLQAGLAALVARPFERALLAHGEPLASRASSCIQCLLPPGGSSPLHRGRLVPPSKPPGEA